MALRDAFSRFLRGEADSQRGKDDSGGGDGKDRSTALNNTADAVDADNDPDMVVLVERLEGFYVPETDEFVPTGGAVQIIEGFEGDDPKVLVQALGDSASGDQGSTANQGAGNEAKR
jgi:hypothetical protein